MDTMTRLFLQAVAYQLERIRQERRERQRKYRQRKRLQAGSGGQRVTSKRSRAP